MRFLGNVIWTLLYGFWAAAAHFLIGIIMCATLILIPFGIQHLKIARYVIWPFGKAVYIDFDRHPIMNILWVVFGGAEMALAFILVGVILCITLIGIPFAKKFFKLASLAFLPFGADVV